MMSTPLKIVPTIEFPLKILIQKEFVSSLASQSTCMLA